MIMIDTWSSFLSEYLNSHTRVLLIRFWPETHIFSHNAILKHFFFFFIVDGISFKDSNLPTRMINKLINIYMGPDLFLYCIWTANECFTVKSPTFSLLFVQSFTWSVLSLSTQAHRAPNFGAVWNSKMAAKWSWVGHAFPSRMRHEPKTRSFKKT